MLQEYEDGELLLPPPRPPQPAKEIVNGLGPYNRDPSPNRDEEDYLQSTYVVCLHCLLFFIHCSGKSVNLIIDIKVIFKFDEAI